MVKGRSLSLSMINRFFLNQFTLHHYSEGNPDGFMELHSPESVSQDFSYIAWHHFHLHHKDYVKTKVRAINGATNFADVESNGYLVDLTQPDLLTLGDGDILGTDIAFQVNCSFTTIIVKEVFSLGLLSMNSF